MDKADAKRERGVYWFVVKNEFGARLVEESARFIGCQVQAA